MKDVVMLEDIIDQAQSKPQSAVTATEHSSLPGLKNKSPRNAKPVVKPENLVPRGQPKSRRFWKTPKTKASKLIATRGLRLASTFEKKEKLRAELKATKEMSRQRLNDRKKQIEDRKERRRDNLRRQEENRKKAEIVQVIRNPAKIKRMRKKQLRNIEKRDTTNL